MRDPFRQTWGIISRGREEWRAVCDKGLVTFEQQHIDVAVAKRARRHQQRNQPPPTTTQQGSACTVCGRVCASAFGLSHMRRHKETRWAASSSNRRTTKRDTRITKTLWLLAKNAHYIRKNRCSEHRRSTNTFSGDAKWNCHTLGNEMDGREKKEVSNNTTATS